MTYPMTLKFDVTNADKTTEQGMLRSLVLLTKGMRLPSPDYKATKFFTQQWRGEGNTLYYQLPKGGLIVAVFQSTADGRGPFYFRTSGFKQLGVQSSFLARASDVSVSAAKKTVKDITEESVMAGLPGTWTDILMSIGWDLDQLATLKFRGPERTKMQSILDDLVKSGKVKMKNRPAEDPFYWKS